MAGRFGPLRLRSNHITKTPLGKARFPGICRARGGKIWYNNHQVASVPGDGRADAQTLFALCLLATPLLHPALVGEWRRIQLLPGRRAAVPQGWGAPDPVGRFASGRQGEPAFYQDGRQRFSGPRQPPRETACRPPSVGGQRPFPANSAGAKIRRRAVGLPGEWFERGGFGPSSNGPLLGRLGLPFSRWTPQREGK